mmetsp:Transcript_9613/g.19388  ORF Transcript_9613/g.19388 Transcript_9613/m.19388 type:complete len:213 (+) Transcript_9613:128-766(+)
MKTNKTKWQTVFCQMYEELLSEHNNKQLWRTLRRRRSPRKMTTRMMTTTTKNKSRYNSKAKGIHLRDHQKIRRICVIMMTTIKSTKNLVPWGVSSLTPPPPHFRPHDNEQNRKKNHHGRVRQRQQQRPILLMLLGSMIVSTTTMTRLWMLQQQMSTRNYFLPLPAPPPKRIFGKRLVTASRHNRRQQFATSKLWCVGSVTAVTTLLRGRGYR